MRSGGGSVQQALTPEAAAVVKHALVMAKRRGHAQVSPLHVANTMMAAQGGLLRGACMQSHSHPLQCKALELCFNVALNRLPSAAAAASSCNPILSHHSPHPSISNALVAAFKRAQAHHHRRADNPPAPPLLTVKIELEQLVISILDDPSVSRVMREAGFSSTQIKNNVEKAIPNSSHSKRDNNFPIVEHHHPSSPPPPTHDQTENDDDVNTIVETLLTNKTNRNLIVVGESISNVEKKVQLLMERVERGGRVPKDLSEVKFITFPPFYTFCNVRRELVQQKIQELAVVVKSLVAKGVVVYLGDLNWISEYRVSAKRERRSSYCSVEHVIMELGRLLSDFAEIGRLWLMGIATFQTYMKCRNGYNSLHMIWRLHPLTIPVNCLRLSLASNSGNENDEGGEDQDMQSGATISSTTLPPWLIMDESRRLSNYNDQKCQEDMSKNRQPKSLERTLTLTSPSPSSSTSCFSINQKNPNLPSNTCSTTTNPPSSENFIEFNANNLNILCNALEEKVPWQKQIIPEIVGTILQCRSGMLRRKESVQETNILDAKQETWLFFLGHDVRGKEEIARNLARFVFGSYSDLVSIGIERFAGEVSSNPHRVFLLEDLELVDCWWRMRIKRAIEMGRMSSEDGEEFSLLDAIVVLSCDSLKKKVEDVGEEEMGSDGSLNLNMCLGINESSDEKLEAVDDLGIIENVDRLVVFQI